MEIYWIGGSTCCGKSSVAEMLCERHGLAYYKLDDFLDTYMQRMAQAGHPLCGTVLGLSMEEMWMRDPASMCREETAIYRDMFPYVEEALSGFDSRVPVVAEGAGLLPQKVREKEVGLDRYVCMVPTREFQREQYARRPWIGEYLKGCSAPQKAFANWMERDALFAEEVSEEARQLGFAVLEVDGSRGLEDSLHWVESVFGLG